MTGKTFHTPWTMRPVIGRQAGQHWVRAPDTKIERLVSLSDWQIGPPGFR